jgi:hypothetical protein
MKNKTLIFVCITIITALSACSKPKTIGSIEITNHSAFELKDGQISITRDTLYSNFGEIPDSKILCVKDSMGNLIPSQLDDLDNDGKWDELALVYNFLPDQKITINLVLIDKAEAPKYKARTQAHFGIKRDGNPVKSFTREVLPKAPLPRNVAYPYKTDGPTWESDMAGYRHYFDGRNCRDFFCKRIKDMVLDTVGIWPDGTIGDTYHTLKSWGRDVLGVGQSFGLGGLAILSEDSLVRLGVVRSDTIDNCDSTVFTLIASGPVRSIIKLDHYGWNVGKTKLNVHQVITIWAGRYVYQNQVKLDGDSIAKFLVTGIVHNNDSNGYKTINYNPGLLGLYTHDKQTYNREYYMGLALLLPNSELKGIFDTPAQGNGILYTYCAKLNAPFRNPLTYYAMAACEIQDEKFRNTEEFIKVLNTEAAIINNPVKTILRKTKY